MKKNNGRPVPRHHPRIFMSRLKSRVSFLVWLLLAGLAVFVYFHGGQFGGMTGTVITNLDNAAPLETGRLKGIYVQIGDTVTKGRLLAEMDASLLEAEKAVLMAQGQALAGELAAVITELTRLEKLLERGLISEQDLLSLRVQQQTLLAEIDAAGTEKEIALLDLRIRNCLLPAQADGTVSRIYHAPGDVVIAGDPILSSVTEGALSVVGFLSEHNARDVTVGMQAYLAPVSGRGATVRARIVALTPEVFTLPGRVNPVPAQTYRGRRVLLEPEAGCLLLPGEEVQIHVRRPWTLQLFGRLLKEKMAP